MTISRYHKLFVLSALICAIPVSDAYSGPIFNKIWGIASNYFSNKSKLPQHPFGTAFPNTRVNSDYQRYSNNFNNSAIESNDSSDAGSGWFSTKTLLAGAAVVAGGYALYKCYSSYKQRQAERAERETREAELARQAEQARQQEERDDADFEERLAIFHQREEARQAAEREAELVRQAEQARQEQSDREAREAQLQAEREIKQAREAAEKVKNIKKALRKRLIAEQKTYLIPRSKFKKEQQDYQSKKRLRLREEKIQIANGKAMFDNMSIAAQAESDDEDEDFIHCEARIILSEQVKNCLLCNQLTVNYLNHLYKDEGKEHKEHVILFLRTIAELDSDQNGWNNQNILDLISKEDPHFVIQRLEYIAKGEQYVRNITSENGQFVPQGNQKEYLDSLISITWYFYAKALKKGDGFSKSASFNIQSNALMNFFMGYYHHVREWHKDFSDMGRAWVAQYAKAGTNKLGDHPFAYERCSSHLKTLNKTNYGIDIRFAVENKSGDQSPKVEYLQTLLPDGKAHLLLIPYDADNGRFLLKPELHATTAFDLPDAAEHGLEFLHGSKDDDYAYTRREKTKKDVKFKELQERYKKIVPGQGNSVDLLTGEVHRSGVDDTKEIAVLGVQHMLRRLNHWIEKSKNDRLRKLQSLKDELIKSYTDNHDIRFAHEVVFKEGDFR